MKFELIKINEINQKDKLEAYGYMFLAEYDLLKLHLRNGINEDFYDVHGANIGRFINDIKSYYDNKNIDGYLVIDNGFYIGMLLHRNDPQKGRYIVTLYVDRSFRKSGVGSYLIKTLIDNCEEDKVTVLVGDFNKPAIALYEKLGFKVLGKSNIKGMTEYQLVKGE